MADEQTTRKWPWRKQADLQDLCALMFGSLAAGIMITLAFERLSSVVGWAFLALGVFLLVMAAKAGDLVWRRIHV